MTAVHLILVWEERDDPNLLRHAQRAKSGGDPAVVDYEASLVPASYSATPGALAGRPVHGIET